MLAATPKNGRPRRRPTTTAKAPVLNDPVPEGSPAGAPRLLRSFAMEIAARNAEAPIVELRPGELFRFAASVPAGIRMWFYQHITAEQVELTEGIDFLTKLVHPEDRAGLDAALSDTAEPVDVMVVWAVRRQLIEYYLARPTQPLTSSPEGQSRDGAASERSAQTATSTPSTSNQPGS
jgi:hypothetical protein